MNPAAHTATSTGISGALLVILVWIFGLWHIAIPGEVSAALGTILTAGIGWFLHTKFAAAAALEAPRVDKAA